ncbi:MAG TPA: arginine--tRNA ligase [Candidatus Peribacteraceae bacterium]|nr:arginine--tRNA ligase [Candidatus Peribacteraceae bacterium]
MFDHLVIEAEQVLSSYFGVTDMPVTWERPTDGAHGDLTTTVALRAAKSLKKKPREIADALAKALSDSPSVAKAEVAGAGYVNVWLTTSALLKELTTVEASIKPRKAKKTDAPIIIEYSQPNIAKPLGVHHIIGTTIGQALVNLYRHAGYNVIAWNYIGDWGTQFGKLAVAYDKWGKDKPVLKYSLNELLALYVKFHDEAENDPTLEDQGREAFRKLEDGDKELFAFWKDVVQVTKASLTDVYKRLHVSFDLDLGESFYQDKMEPILEEGRKKKVFVTGEGGSLIVEFPAEMNMPPYLVQKSDGATLYSTRDIAQMKYRIETYHPAAIYILTDIAQKLHFEQLIETCKQLKWELPAFENILFGRMRFADKSMSTRKGNILDLTSVLDEAVKRADEIIKERGDAIQTDDPKDLAEMMGTGALVYGILSQNRKMDLVFDWDKMLSFDGNSAPYIQYTHARATSVLRKAESDGSAMPKAVEAFSDAERALIQTLLQFSAVLNEARTDHLPHKLANYLYQLCQDFNLFYNVDPILRAEGEQRALRLALTAQTASVIKTGAELLTLRVPERM